MWHALQIALRILAGAIGVLSFYAALFLYEDEQGKLQNKLEEWWVNLSDQQTKSLSRYAVLMRSVATLSTRSFSALFGEKIISFRALAVSACYSVASLCLFIVVTCVLGVNPLWLSGFPMEIALVGIAFAVFGSLPALIRKSKGLMIAWYLVLGGIFAIIGLFWFGSWLLFSGQQDMSSPQIEVLQLHIFLPFSFACTATFLAITRWALRWCAGMDSALKIGVVVLIDIAIAMFLTVLPLKLGAYTLAELNSGDTLICLVFVLLFALMLAHRLLWPVVSRTFYAVATRTGVRRSIFTAVGIACLGYAGVSRTLVQKITELFAG